MSMKFLKAKVVPSLVGEFIDDVMLPNLADGYRSSNEVAVEIQEYVQNSLNEFFELPSELDKDDSMVWSWLAQERNLNFVESYVDRAYFLW